MRIKIKTGWLNILTETSRRQIVVVAIICIMALEIVNMFTTKYDTGLMEYVIASITALAGYEYGRRTSARKKVKSKTSQ